jgi:DNA polymerase-3 subunit gamma/tau
MADEADRSRRRRTGRAAKGKSETTLSAIEPNLSDKPASEDDPSEKPPSSPAESSGEYVVVARRYRPQTFDDLVGQGMVCQALRNAIASDRVGHAYLFTGARGVGKTSTARILAKSLNCVHGPTPTPCGQCDICQRIASGDDVDVLEFDGASNRGIDEIRQLRSNVGIRPSRARLKVYIIDEVHMLTKEAFNALLKTLEEPPEHVKFIFCTTEPGKIPVTVLSRCQRFDFAPVMTAEIVDRLQYIVDQEGAQADCEALELLARRAAGSMRDSQSLLEQLLSFVNQRITVDDVHSMLGTAPDIRLHAILDALNRRDAAAALAESDRALKAGVDAGQLAEQLVGCLRDMMAALVGCEGDLLLHHRPSDLESLRTAAIDWGLETLLAAVQIVDQSVTRMRQSVHERILLDLALVRVAQLENLEGLTNLLARLEADEVSGERTLERGDGGDSKNPPPNDRSLPVEGSLGGNSIETRPRFRSDAAHPVTPPRAALARSAAGSVDPRPVPALIRSTEAALSADQVGRVWRTALDQLNDMTAENAAMADSVAISGPNQLVVRFRQVYNSSKSFCERPDRRQTLEATISELAGHSVGLSFELIQEEQPEATQVPAAMSRQQQRQLVSRHPMVERAMALFEAELMHVEPAQSDQRQGDGTKGR